MLAKEIRGRVQMFLQKTDLTEKKSARKERKRKRKNSAADSSLTLRGTGVLFDRLRIAPFLRTADVGDVDASQGVSRAAVRRDAVIAQSSRAHGCRGLACAVQDWSLEGIAARLCSALPLFPGF